MIIDKIENAHQYYGLGENIKKGLKFIAENNLKNFESGKYNIDGEKVYISIQEYRTKKPEEGKWEAHKKYTDIQYIIEGEEKLGFSFAEKCKAITEYDTKNDIYFLEGDGNYLTAKEGYFIIFTPNDIHKPSLCITEPQTVKKAVVKLLQ